MGNYNEIFNKMFADRTHCILFQASVYTEENHGWIGGNAPEYFDDKIEMVNINGMKHHFYVSFIDPLEEDKMISIFIPSYEEYVDNNIYPNCSIQVFDHPVTKESISDAYSLPGLKKHSIVGGDVMLDEESIEKSFFIKLGGAPRLIQDEDYYFTDLHQNQFEFLLQIDEDGYPDSLMEGDISYPFNYGALYVFTQIKGDSIYNPIAGFWQFS